MPKPIRLLFVCTANICRSPMAEGLAPMLGSGLGIPVEARSACIMRKEGSRPATNAVKVMKELGIDISSNKSKRIAIEDVEWADYVLAMAPKHAGYARQKFPMHQDKILLLGTFGGMLKIPDPVGGWKFTFRRNRKTIQKCIERFLSQVPKG